MLLEYAVAPTIPLVEFGLRPPRLPHKTGVAWGLAGGGVGRVGGWFRPCFANHAQNTAVYLVFCLFDTKGCLAFLDQDALSQAFCEHAHSTGKFSHFLPFMKNSGCFCNQTHCHKCSCRLRTCPTTTWKAAATNQVAEKSRCTTTGSKTQVLPNAASWTVLHLCLATWFCKTVQTSQGLPEVSISAYTRNLLCNIMVCRLLCACQ